MKKKTLFPVDKKLVFTCQNEELAENCSSWRKTASTSSSWLLSEKMEENGLHEPENPFSLAEWRILVKNTFPLDEKKKKLSLVGISENGGKIVCISQKVSCPLAGIIFPSKNFFLKMNFVQFQ